MPVVPVGNLRVLLKNIFPVMPGIPVWRSTDLINDLIQFRLKRLPWHRNSTTITLSSGLWLAMNVRSRRLANACCLKHWQWHRQQWHVRFSHYPVQIWPQGRWNRLHIWDCIAAWGQRYVVLQEHKVSPYWILRCIWPGMLKKKSGIVMTAGIEATRLEEWPWEWKWRKQQGAS